MAERDVCRDRVAEEEVVLKDDADVPPQIVDVHAADIDSIELHAPLLDVVVAGEQVEQTRLPRAGFAD